MLIFDKLTKNAIDFFEKSNEEFDQHPKSSLLNFCFGFEILLKSRLVEVHWALIACDINKIRSLSQFEKGEVITVGHKEAIHRINNLLNENINLQNQVKIDELFAARNRLIHFYDEDFDDREKVDLIKEQLIAWHILYNELIKSQWKDIFHSYFDLFSKIDDNLKSHRSYLQAIFDNMSPNLNQMKRDGAVFQDCPACNFLSYQTLQLQNIDFQRCHVCGFNDFPYIICSHCGKDTLMLGEGEPLICNNCNHLISTEQILDAYIEKNYLTKDNYFEGYPIAHCRECGSDACVVEAKTDVWICLECFTKFQKSDINPCDYCGELNAGDIELSSIYGCNACSGSEG